MSKIIVSSVQGTGGQSPALTLPIANGTSGQVVRLANSTTGQLDFGTPPLLPTGTTSSKDVIGMIRSSSAQSNTYGAGAWGTGPYTTYNQRYLGHPTQDNQQTTIQAWNMLMGDGYPNGTSQINYVNNREGNYQRYILFAHGNRIGHWISTNYYDYNITSDYTGLTWQLIPVRNTSGVQISRTFYLSYQSNYQSYGGVGVGVYTPNAALMQEVTSGTWAQVFTHTSNTTSTTNFSVTIPANTTVLLFTGTTHQYQGTYKFYDVHQYYNLSTQFDSTVICDLEMLKTLYMGRDTNAGYTSMNPHRFYPMCAQLFGDK